jgi:hypothetical protein
MTGLRLYDLRHTAVSLMIRQGGQHQGGTEAARRRDGQHHPGHRRAPVPRRAGGPRWPHGGRPHRGPGHPCTDPARTSGRAPAGTCWSVGGLAGAGGGARTLRTRKSGSGSLRCCDAGIRPLTSQNRLSQDLLRRLVVTRGFTVCCGPTVARPWPRGPPSCSCPSHSAGPHPISAGRPHGTQEITPPMTTNDISARRRVLLLDVTQAAAEVSRLVHEARDLNLPVEPGVRDGRNALVRWAVLLQEVLP